MYYDDQIDQERIEKQWKAAIEQEANKPEPVPHKCKPKKRNVPTTHNTDNELEF